MLLAPSSLSFTRSPLASTDHFHNHFSEVTASSAVVTQPLACSVSFTCTYTLLQQYYTTLHYTKPRLKETARVSPSSHNMLQTLLLKGQHVYFWLCVLKAFLLPLHATCGCGAEMQCWLMFRLQSFLTIV